MPLATLLQCMAAITYEEQLLDFKRKSEISWQTQVLAQYIAASGMSPDKKAIKQAGEVSMVKRPGKARTAQQPGAPAAYVPPTNTSRSDGWGENLYEKQRVAHEALEKGEATPEQIAALQAQVEAEVEAMWAAGAAAAAAENGPGAEQRLINGLRPAPF